MIALTDAQDPTYRLTEGNTDRGDGRVGLVAPSQTALRCPCGQMAYLASQSITN